MTEITKINNVITTETQMTRINGSNFAHPTLLVV